jgi:hypothetical protein
MGIAIQYYQSKAPYLGNIRTFEPDFLLTEGLGGE